MWTKKSLIKISNIILDIALRKDWSNSKWDNFNVKQIKNTAENFYGQSMTLKKCVQFFSLSQIKWENTDFDILIKHW